MIIMVERMHVFITRMVPMKKFFQWIVEFLDVIVGVTEEQPNKSYRNAYETPQKYEDRVDL